MDIATDSRQVTRLEIVDTGRRRRWSEGEKRRIVEESYSAPRQASATARRHGISNQLLFAWRKAHREGGLGDGSPCDFVPAMLVPENKAPTTCACCGGSRLAKIGEDVTKTLEEIPRRFKLIETVREKFTCRDCEKISQPPAPFHATPRGFIGPQLLATILFDKFGMHIPLNRQSVRFKCEGIDLPLSTLADQVGHGTFAVMSLFHLIERHVLAAERLHGDDTTIRILAKGKCTTGRIWTYVRDYAHLVIMRSSQEQELIAIGFSDDFRLANCA